MVLIKHALVDVDAIASQYNLSKYFFWNLFRTRKADTIPDSGVTKTGRTYRIDAERFEKWFLGNRDGVVPTPPPPPPLYDQGERPTRREAMTALSNRLDLLQATVRSQGEKLDNLTRLVMDALKLGANHDGKRRK